MEQARPESHDPYAALRHRDYRLLLGGGVLASIGSQIQTMAVYWELDDRTHDPADIGLAGLTQFVPVLLLALPAGHVADRFTRKHVVQAAQVGMMLAGLGLAGLSLVRGPVPLIYACLFLAGTCRAFIAPARGALVPAVVPAEHLANAVTWNSSGWQLASVSGPFLSGLLIEVGGRRAVGAYLVAAGCAAACALLLMPARPRAAARPVESPSLASLLAGVRFVWRTQLLLAALTLDLFAVLLGGAMALLPLYARDILHVGPVGLGWLWAAPALGALVMALAMAHVPPLRRPGVALLLAVAGFGAATVGFGLSDDPAVSFAFLALTGAFDNVSVVVRGTLVQVLTPDDMRGRVGAVNFIFISSSNELGACESGYTANWFGAVPSVVGGGLGTILVVVGVMLLWPGLLRLGPLHRPAVVTPEEAAGQAAEAETSPPHP
jgi:MFS family permease